jgi:hypothetical protein
LWGVVQGYLAHKKPRTLQFRVQGSGFRVQGSGFRTSGPATTGKRSGKFGPDRVQKCFDFVPDLAR